MITWYWVSVRHTSEQRNGEKLVRLDWETDRSGEPCLTRRRSEAREAARLAVRNGAYNATVHQVLEQFHQGEPVSTVFA
jgi:hypothetical protein